MGVPVQEPESVAAPQTFGVPAPPHVWPAGQTPQFCVPPQPLPMVPQYWPPLCVQLTGVGQLPPSGDPPQTLGSPPPPQVDVPGQTPQSIVPPQPLPTMPQYWPPTWLQVSFWQPPSGK
jgi:hypothetical protein